MAKRKIFYDEELVIKLYNEGKTLVEISKQIGASRELLARFLEKSGIRKRNSIGYSEEEIQEWIKYYNENSKSLYCVWKKFGVTRNIIRREFIKRDILKYQTKLALDIKSIVEEFRATKQIESTAIKFSIDSNTLINILISEKIDISEKSSFLSSKREEIKRRYLESKSLKNTAKEFNISIAMVRKILKQDKIDIVRTKYTWDNEFFSRDTQESFYFAGFIAADGCICDSKYSNTLKICIKESDREILDEFKKYITFDGPIKEYLGKVNISITSDKICKDLERFGIGPRKSFTYRIPKEIAEHKLVNHFIRGLIDGDGHISSKGRVCIGLCGSKDCVDRFIQILNKNCQVRMKPARVMKSIFCVSFHGDEARTINNFIYMDAKEGLFLKRKKNNSERKTRTRADTRKSVVGIRGDNIIKFDSLTAALKSNFSPCAIHRSARTGHQYKQYVWSISGE